MEKTEQANDIEIIIAELNTILFALGNRDIFSETTQDVCISLIKVRDHIERLSKDMGDNE
ncbi:MAG: hypothetical protein MRZ41_08680 [Eubacterium sp.]|nr:hypothetical protein [Eubacterium sp.]